MESIPVVVTQISDIAPLSSKELLDLQATSACRFTVKRIYDIMRKNFFPIHTVLLNHFIYSRVKTSKILHGPSKNWVKAISVNLIRKQFLLYKLFTTDPHEKSYLPIWFTIIHMVIEEILSPTTLSQTGYL